LGLRLFLLVRHVLSSSRAGYARIFIYENVVHLTSFDYTPVDAHQSKSGIAVELRAC
jgi:hypothetical protein